METEGEKYWGLGSSVGAGTGGKGGKGEKGGRGGRYPLALCEPMPVREREKSWTGHPTVLCVRV
jgi:hypothetical protein